jgi:hypothetical protein
VRRIGDEAALRIEGRLQAIEPAIDGAHQRMEIGTASASPPMAAMSFRIHFS